jgi:hypothetical protein
VKIPFRRKQKNAEQSNALPEPHYELEEAPLSPAPREKDEPTEKDPTLRSRTRRWFNRNGSFLGDAVVVTGVTGLAVGSVAATGGAILLPALLAGGSGALPIVQVLIKRFRRQSVANDDAYASAEVGESRTQRWGQLALSLATLIGATEVLGLRILEGAHLTPAVAEAAGAAVAAGAVSLQYLTSAAFPGSGTAHPSRTSAQPPSV